MASQWQLSGAFVLLSALVFSTGFASQEADVNQLNSLPDSNPLNIKQIFGKECKGGYSPNCIKLGLIWLVKRSGGFNLPVFPGVTINAPGLPESSVPQPSDLASQPEKIDEVLLEKLSDYLSSMSLNVKVMDKKTPLGFARSILGDDVDTGVARKKNAYGGALAAAGLISGGTLLAMGMAALAAMAGKAMMASLLALMLSALSALKGGGGGGEKTTYEIVAKPVVSHLSTHSSEVQHGHGHGGHYRRSMDIQPIVYSAHIPVERR